MNTHSLFSLLLLSLFIFFFSSSTLLPSPSLAATAHRCHPGDYKSLMKIKNDLNNPYHLKNWETNTDCCDWCCLRCDVITNRVVELFISGDMSGQIPSSVADLPYLLSLTFRKNPNITGSIPSSILKLKRLEMLWMDWNSLSGPIPDFLSQISSLNQLDLSFNQFSGSIPSSLSNLNKLIGLFLSRNNLTGSIPESFGKFNSSSTGLHLDLSHNQLSGPIPKSLSYVDFGIINLSRNKLDGDGSVLFNLKRKTTNILLSRNLLDFDLTNVRFPVNLTYLDLSHNKIRGMIPEQMKDLDLYGLNVSYNRLCGKIPSGRKFPKYDYSTYFHNKCLCGSPLPTCKGKSDKLVNVPAA